MQRDKKGWCTLLFRRVDDARLAAKRSLQVFTTTTIAMRASGCTRIISSIRKVISRKRARDEDEDEDEALELATPIHAALASATVVGVAPIAVSAIPTATVPVSTATVPPVAPTTTASNVLRRSRRISGESVVDTDAAPPKKKTKRTSGDVPPASVPSDVDTVANDTTAPSTLRRSTRHSSFIPAASIDPPTNPAPRPTPVPAGAGAARHKAQAKANALGATAAKKANVAEAKANKAHNAEMKKRKAAEKTQKILDRERQWL